MGFLDGLIKVAGVVGKTAIDLGTAYVEANASSIPRDRLEKMAAGGNRMAQRALGIEEEKDYGMMDTDKLERLTRNGDQEAAMELVRRKGGDWFEKQFGYSAFGDGGLSCGNVETAVEEDNVVWQIEGGSFVDERDGQVYRTVKMPDGKFWMAQNLNYKTQDSWWYDNNKTNGEKYGRLYTWYAAKMACPAGWHLPSSQEWEDLITTAGDWVEAGKLLKSKSGWNKKGNGMDRYGFSALPGGDRASDGSFDGAGDFGYWWTATKDSKGNTYCRHMYYGGGNVSERQEDKWYGYSVRCVKD